ncbi:hypothetical protein [Luteimonas sp. SDU82]|uniref:hypothetical protein n=1 Tax=Luteimonas sp. SDU82 TaxID=3422592 RepID=UPI003EBAC8A9
MTSAAFARSRGWAGLTVLFLLSTASACGKQPHEQRVESSPSQSKQVLPASGSGPAAHGPDNEFALEEAMGAECDSRWISDPPLHEKACYGMLPEHLQSLLLGLPDTHPHLSEAQRQEAVASRQRFRAVPGYGERPDFVADITNYSRFWVRSFEGPDPETTVYAVYGPACSDDRAHSKRSVGEGCLAGEPYVMRELKIYRVTAGGAPEDVTSELAPPPPILSPAEKERYGIYLRPPQEGGAVDTDIGLDVGSLAKAPVMRWVIDPPEEGDYERPYIPDSDPRGFFRRAHFGFLVWTGERFELRRRIQLSLWACGLGKHAAGCADNFRGDSYLVDTGASEELSGDME